MDEYFKFHAPMARYLSTIYYDNIEYGNMNEDGFGSIAHKPEFDLTLKQFGVLSLLSVGFSSSRPVRHFDLDKNISRAQIFLEDMKGAGVITIEDDTKDYTGGIGSGARPKEYGYGKVVMNGFDVYYKKFYSTDKADVAARKKRSKESEKRMNELLSSFK